MSNYVSLANRKVAKMAGLLGLAAFAIAFFAFPAVSFAAGGSNAAAANLPIMKVIGDFDTTAAPISLNVNNQVPATLQFHLQTLNPAVKGAAKQGKWLLGVDAQGNPDLVMEKQGAQTGLDIHGKIFKLVFTGAPAIAAPATISN